MPISTRPCKYGQVDGVTDAVGNGVAADARSSVPVALGCTVTVAVASGLTVGVGLPVAELVDKAGLEATLGLAEWPNAAELDAQPVSSIMKINMENACCARTQKSPRWRFN